MDGLAPFAQHRLMPYADTLPKREASPTLIIHTNGGGTDHGSLFGYFSRPGNHIASHFQVMTVGTCLVPEHRVLTADLRWVPGGSLSVGDELVAFDESGATISGGRRYRRSVIERVDFAVAPVYAVVLSDGNTIYTTADHRWLAQTKESWTWRKTIDESGRTLVGARIPRLFDPWETRSDFEAGWFAGFLDGEGTLAAHHRLGFSQRPTAVLDRAVSFLKDEGLAYSIRPVSGGDCQYVDIAGTLPDRMRVLGSLRPTRLLPKANIDTFGALRGRKTEHRTVLAVYPVGEREIVKLQTSTRTFFAEGYGMHNCEQYVPITHQAYAQYAGNDFGVSAETQDDGHPEKPWSDAQLESLVKLARWLDVPAKVSPDGKGGGIGWHSLYLDWNRSGHNCPGSVRVRQIHDVILPELAKSTGGHPSTSHPHPSGQKQAGGTHTYPARKGPFRQGARGEWITWIQERLHLHIDGDFGPETERAVKAFQHAHGLTVDGVVGPATWRALFDH